MGLKIDELLHEAETAHGGDNSINSAERRLADGLAAKAVYDAAKLQLLDIEQWKLNSTPSSYELFDEGGNVISGRPIDKGDLIRISIYGSGKYDWVRVTNIYETPAEFIITVSPSFDPTSEPVDRTVISHFFIPQATNNFCLRHRGDTVSMWVIGLNEKQNTTNAAGIIDAARNAGVANLGYYLGLQKAVWTEFCNRFLTSAEEQVAS